MSLFLRAHERRKDGKVHKYWSLVENRRCADQRVVQRHVLYLGALTPAQELSWARTAHAFDPPGHSAASLPGLATERELQAHEVAAIAVHLHQFRIERPRQWGACWVALTLWNFLKLSDFWRERLPASREGTHWLNVLITLVVYRLIDPGSEWRLHRHWYEQSALADLLGEDFALAAKDNLYRCLDRLLPHRHADLSCGILLVDILIARREDVERLPIEAVRRGSTVVKTPIDRNRSLRHHVIVRVHTLRLIYAQLLF